jgi:hypothetical protein
LASLPLPPLLSSSSSSVSLPISSLPPGPPTLEK